MSQTWHAGDGLLRSYVDGTADPMVAASLEQHLTHCPECRARITGHVDPAPLELTWDRIRDEAQAPRRSVVERVLTGLRVPAPDALLIAVAPSMRASWLFGLVVTLGFVGLSAGYGGSHGPAVFLLLAPLLPVAGVAFSYGPDVDPGYEVGLAAPYSAARLLLLRTAAVLAACLPLVLATGLLIPGLSWTAVAWLVPAVSFTAVVLAATTWIPPVPAAAGVTVGWFCAVAGSGLATDAAAVLAPALLFGYAALGLAALFVLRLRIHHLTALRSLS
jgi:Putative zinc-finger